MHYKNIQINTLNSLKPNNLKNYALSSGWTRAGELPGKFFIYTNGEKELLVPIDVEFDDYHRRIADAIELISKVENRPIERVINDVFTPNVDVIRYRLSGSDYDNGTAPLVEGLNLIGGSKKALYVSAMQVNQPKKHYKFLKNSDADEFLSKCRLGQTERGSFISTLVCPIGLSSNSPQQVMPIDGLTEEERIGTFTRKVTTNLVKGMYLVKKAIDDDNLGVLHDEENNPLVSSNFCDSLVEMQPLSSNSSLEVGVKFSTRDVIPQSAQGIISLRKDYFSEISQISNDLRPIFQEEEHTLYCGVNVCQGTPNDDGRMEGDVILSFIFEESHMKAKVYLRPDDYQNAVDAHKRNKNIKIVGDYIPSVRQGKITGYREFSILD